MSDDREQIRIDRLSLDQRLQLQVYLNGAQIPFELTPGTVSVDAAHIDDLYAVLQLVGNANTPLPPEEDDDGTSARPPVVVHREETIHGRPIAAPVKRFLAAVIDWFVITTGTIIAAKAGAPNWMIVFGFGLYVVICTAFWGRTIGKYAAGIKVIGAHNGSVPGFLRSSMRWLAVSWGAVMELVYGTWPIGIATLIFVALMLTYAPILWDPRGRGWHDRAADTVVVEIVR